jgi:hypothetical protein
MPADTVRTEASMELSRFAHTARQNSQEGYIAGGRVADHRQATLDVPGGADENELEIRGLENDHHRRTPPVLWVTFEICKFCRIFRTLPLGHNLSGAVRRGG